MNTPNFIKFRNTKTAKELGKRGYHWLVTLSAADFDRLLGAAQENEERQERSVSLGETSFFIRRP